MSTLRPCRFIINIAALGLILLALFLIPNQEALAAGPEEELLSGLMDDSNEPWELEADSMTGLYDAEVVEAEGNVVLRRGENYLIADFARYYRETQWVYLSGNVRAKLGGDEVLADEAEFDLTNHTGWLRNGRLFFAEPHLYLSGAYVEKNDDDSYTFKEAKVTSCDGDRPAWSFGAEEGQVTIEGYAELYGASFSILDQPVLWSPYLIVPAKTKRSTGLLFPEAGYSNRLGAFANLPFYWAIDEENDMTFYFYGMSSRGYMQGIEYRHFWDLETKGLWHFDYMHDQTAALSDDEGGPLSGDGLSRTNHNRYWWRSKFDTTLSWFGLPDWEVKLDIDYVSDQNYLREFDNGFSGFEASREAFLDEFGRDLPESDENRVSTLLVRRDSEYLGVAAKMEYVQGVNFGHGNGNEADDTTLKRLPELAVYLFKNRIPLLDESLDGNLPLELSGQAMFTYFWRPTGTTGYRMNVHPVASLPIITDYFTIIPSAGWDSTFYFINEHEETTHVEDDDTYFYRSIPHVDVTMYSEIFRVFDLTGGDELTASLDNLDQSLWTSIKHSLQPRVEYSFVPNVDQQGNPYFDDYDRVEEVNQITYSLSNTFSRRQETVVMAQGPDGDPMPSKSTDYQEFLRIRLEQSFDINEATREDERNTYDVRPFSDFLADVTFIFNDYVSLSNRTWFSPYLGQITEHEHALILGIPDRLRLTLAMDFQDDIDEYTRPKRSELNLFRAGLDLTLLYGFGVGFKYEVDFLDLEEMERALSLSYQHQCFDVRVQYSETPMEQRVQAWFNLVGLELF